MTGLERKGTGTVLSGGRVSTLGALAGVIAVAIPVGCGLSLTIATLAVRLDQAGFSARAIGLNTAVEGIAVLVGAPFVPRLARRLGTARLLAAALIAAAAIAVSFALIGHYAAWLVLRFAVGLSATIVFVLGEFWITSVAPARRTGIAIAIYVTSLAIGSALGPLVLALAGPAGALPFVLAGILFVAASIPIVLHGGAAPPIEAAGGDTLLAVLRRAPVATLAGALHGAIEAAAFSLLPVYALHAGVTVAVSASLVSVFILGTTMLQLPIGWIADRVDRRALLLILAMTGAGGAALLATLTLRDALTFRLALLAWGGIVGAFYPVGLNHLGADFGGSGTGRGGRAGANAAFVMTYALGVMVGPPLIGVGLDLAPPAGLFWTVAVLIVGYGGFVGIQILQRRAPPRRHAVLD